MGRSPPPAPLGFHFNDFWPSFCRPKITPCQKPKKCPKVDPGAPQGSIFLVFVAAPRAMNKSMIFRNPPKSVQGVKKSTQGRPRVYFSWILTTFWLNFSQIFMPHGRTMNTSGKILIRPGGMRACALNVNLNENVKVNVSVSITRKHNRKRKRKTYT